MTRIAGSPPHAWGQLPGRCGWRGRLRFTPTCVGTAFTDELQRRVQKVHPHMRGDSRAATTINPATSGSPPHAWGQSALCSKRITFQHTFPLPRRSQSKPTPTDRAAASDPVFLKTTDRRRPGKPPRTNPAPDFTKSTRATTVETASAANAKQTPEERREFERVRSQTPERKEYRRQLRRKPIRIAKETGKCKDCSNPAIPGQTKCETCAEKHRQRRRKDDANRRAKANQMPGLQEPATPRPDQM